MQAVVYRRYGGPEVLRCEDIPKPAAADDDILIQVRAASVNPYDWHFMRGLPYPVRLIAGLRRPKNIRFGFDVSGQVEAVGKNVTQIKPGDAVFGFCQGNFAGSFAEYASVPESSVVLKPRNVTFEQAASVPMAAVTALQGLREKGRIQPRSRVLINGASGGVGTFGVQIAKWYGADVTAVCSARNADMVRQIGADRVIDYAQTDFTTSAPHYDLILDAVGNRSLGACRRVLTSQGTLVMAGGTAGRWMIGPLVRSLKAAMQSRSGGQKLLGLLAKANRQDLTTLSGLLEAGRITPVIDRIYGLHEVPEAIRYLENGHARGKVVIAVELNR